MKSFYLSFIFMSITGVSAFTPSSSLTALSRSNGKQESKSTSLQMKQQDKAESFRNGIAGILTASAIAVSTIGFNTDRAFAYDDFSDNDVDTVSNVVQSLKDTQGDAAASFKVFESINDIITEGKGVGGMISSSGVRLERGYVADEDTTIYNPGLSLLTESEKEKIVNAVIENRKANLNKNTWNSDNEFAFDFLKIKLDPLHMTELKGFLGFVPIYGAGLYLTALAVQQFARNLFEPAYIISAVAVFLPILVLIAKGV